MMDLKKEVNNISIKVIGVGGCGVNVIRKLSEHLEGYEDYLSLIMINTDKSELNKGDRSKFRRGINLLGITSNDTSEKNNQSIVRMAIGTSGIGAGAIPEEGERAALESKEEIRKVVRDCDIVVVIAGLGGGTGSGATWVVAQTAKEEGKLVISIAIKPFDFEGPMRKFNADVAQVKLEEVADTTFIISNQKLFDILGKNADLPGAFDLVNKLIITFIQKTASLLNEPSLVNVDFADLKTIIIGKGRGVFSFAETSGDDAASKAAEEAVVNKLLEHGSIKGAGSLLIYIMGNKLSLNDVNGIFDIIKRQVGEKAKIIFGADIEKPGNENDLLTKVSNNKDSIVKVLIIATDFSKEQLLEVEEKKPVKKSLLSSFLNLF
jgi:cell division protein FtsZ